MPSSSAILIAAPHRDVGSLAELLRQRLPGVDVRVWPRIGNPEEIVFVIGWNPPDGLFPELVGLRAVSSLGAGVDALLAHPELPGDCPVGRLAGARLAADMAAYVLAMIVNRWKGLDECVEAQRGRRWCPRLPTLPPAVGLLGSGFMGERVATLLEALAFPVRVWNRSGTRPPGRAVLHGPDALRRIAGDVDVLVNLLPLTPSTFGLLDRGLFDSMNPGSTLINVGRGEHVVDDDLLAALDSNRPGFAVLDVFRTEPLPASHPFWDHPKIRITPHCGALTSPEEAAELAAESYRHVMRGEPPLGVVDRTQGY